MIITIDGPAGSGKSTIASLLSEKLGYIHINSGSLYRGITAHLIDIGYDIANMNIDSPIPDMRVDIDFSLESFVTINSRDYSSRLRDLDVTKLTPIVAQNRLAHNIIDETLRKYAKNKNVVTDGREMGSNVFPNAEYKFYLECNVEERARRRLIEYANKGVSLNLNDTINDLKERDFLDKTREIAPLVIPDNAIIVDSSHLTIDQVINTMLDYINL